MVLTRFQRGLVIEFKKSLVKDGLNFMSSNLKNTQESFTVNFHRSLPDV